MKHLTRLDTDICFGLLPFAIIAGKANLLMEQLEKDESKPSKNICTMIHEYLGGEE